MHKQIFLMGLNLKESTLKLSIGNCTISEIDVNKKHKAGYLIKTINEKLFLEGLETI